MQVPETTPPLEPLQVQVQGPVPVMEEGLPLMQVAVGNVYELAVAGQVPSTDLLTVQVPEAVPPSIPSQVQVQGPVPETADGVPEIQLAVGMVYELATAGQTPLIGVKVETQ